MSPGAAATPGPAGGARSAPRRAARRRLFLTAAMGTLALFAAFAVLASLSGPHSGLSAWDGRVTEAFAFWRTPGRSHLFWVMTLIGNDPVLAALSFSAVLLLAVWGRRARAALLAIGLLVGWGVSEAAKAIVGRVRPPAGQALIKLPSSHSMPSGHALSTVVFLGLLVYLTWRAGLHTGPRGGEGGAPAARGAPPAAHGGGGRIWVALAIGAALMFAGLIGVSRVYLGVHWMSDVLGGWCLGGAWLGAYLGVLRGWVHGRRGHVTALLRRHPAAPDWVRVAAVAFAVAVCVVSAVLNALADPLLGNM